MGSGEEAATAKALSSSDGDFRRTVDQIRVALS
jgi:hypothetical protein